MYDMDIIFLVDRSCALTNDECNNQHHGIADLMLSIKPNETDIRFGYVEFNGCCNRILPTQTKISLTHTYDRLELANKIRNYKCFDYNAWLTNTNHGIVHAINDFYDKERMKRLVIISNCEYDNKVVTPCDLRELLDTNNIQVSVVNIAAVATSDIQNPKKYLSCLAPKERIYSIKKCLEHEFDDILEPFAENICVADTLSPTVQGTQIPTISPMDNECNNDCDAFTVKVNGMNVIRSIANYFVKDDFSYENDDIVCYEYLVERRSDIGECESNLESILLNICDDDKHIIKNKKDLKDIFVWYTDDDNSDVSFEEYQGRYGIGIRVYLDVKQIKIFTICLKGVNENEYMSDNVVFKRGRRVYECNNNNNDGLPCMFDGMYANRRNLIEYDNYNKNKWNRFNRMYWIGIFMGCVFIFTFLSV
eukprot:329442_1